MAPVDGTSTVDSLRPVTKGHNLVVKVLEAKTVVNRPARGKLEAQQVAEVLVGDETGSVLLRAKNEQVELAQPGAYLSLTNAKVEINRGSIRLVVDKWGKVEHAEGQSFKPRTDFNMSLVEFEFVAFDGTA